jgi:hypothetical protein
VLEPGFFGVPILSERVVFVLDLSGRLRGDKLEAARAELIRAIGRLPDAARFNLILLGCEPDGRYDPGSKAWAPSLQPATEASRARAVEFIRRQQARGYTNLYDALALAMVDPDADTICLYSDGGASRGTFVDSAEIADRIAAENRFRRIRIHTVLSADAAAREWQARLMRDLAERSGGRHVQP